MLKYFDGLNEALSSPSSLSSSSKLDQHRCALMPTDVAMVTSLCNYPEQLNLVPQQKGKYTVYTSILTKVFLISHERDR